LREALGIYGDVIPITYKKVRKNYYGTEEREGNNSYYPRLILYRR
jgi:hypothetical protein